MKQTVKVAVDKDGNIANCLKADIDRPNIGFKRPK